MTCDSTRLDSTSLDSPRLHSTRLGPGRTTGGHTLSGGAPRFLRFYRDRAADSRPDLYKRCTGIRVHGRIDCGGCPVLSIASFSLFLHHSSLSFLRSLRLGFMVKFCRFLSLALVTDFS